jgi:hypothetical protein
MLKSSKIFFTKRIVFVKENENLLECSEIFVWQNGTFKIYLFNKHVSKLPRYYGIYENVSPHPSPQRFAHQIRAFHCCLQLAIGHSLPEID